MLDQRILSPGVYTVKKDGILDQLWNINDAIKYIPQRTRSTRIKDKIKLFLHGCDSSTIPPIGLTFHPTL